MKLTIRQAAEDDILHEVERYVSLAVPDVALRFQLAVVDALGQLCATPEAGAPRRLQNPRLAGLRTWPVKGFDAFRIFYIYTPAELDVLRVLHGKRDIQRILDTDD